MLFSRVVSRALRGMAVPLALPFLCSMAVGVLSPEYPTLVLAILNVRFEPDN